MSLWILVFWIASGLILYTYLIYPAVLWLLTRRTRQPRLSEPAVWPSVSLVLAAYNEAGVIRAKIDNTLALDYPAERFQFIVVSDGSTDATDEIVAEYAQQGVCALRMPRNGGKTLAQNAGCRLATGDILVFSDANSMYEPQALKELVKPFADPQVGCVCGELHYANPRQAAAGKGEGLYWRYERFLKRHESLLVSALGANGSIYAVRRDLFVELDADIISDFIMPVRVWRNGYRVLYEPGAIATESAGGSFQAEFRRRTRIVSRSLRGLWTERAVLNPWTNGYFAMQVWSHKVLRWMVPVFLAVMLAASLALAGAPLYRLILGVQLIFYLLALLGYLFQNRVGRIALLYIPAYFCAINLGALVGIWNFLVGKRYQAWQPIGRD